MASSHRSRSSCWGLALVLLVAAMTATLSSAFLAASSLYSRRLQQLQLGQARRPARMAAATTTMSAGGKEWALIFDCDGVILEVRRQYGSIHACALVPPLRTTD